jgi:gliding motility-associated-like protein
MLLGTVGLYAQLPGDECDNVIQLPNINDYCSENAEYTTVGYTNSILDPPTCWAGSGNDIWLSFIATADNVTITVRGNTPSEPGGTMSAPTVALYTTPNCINYNELQCATSNGGQATLYKGGLQPGETYYIRIKNAGAAAGSFKLCYVCYFLPDEVSSDCPSGVHICDKTTFVLPSVIGDGDINEGDGSCLSNIPPAETNSIWLTWVCDQSGTFTFDLTPTDAADDLDFAVYKLPNGLGDCTGSELQRCCASGDFIFPSVCMGSTGLSLTSTDITEDAGCDDPNKDNYVRYLDMVADETYGLLINNFTSTGNGFKIEFGGSATLKGAEPEMNIVGPDTGCVNGVYDFFDLSTSIAGPIISWKWNFGVGATPAGSTTVGPHSVSYSTPGTKLITLEVETSEGCKVAEVRSFVIVPLDVATEIIVQPTCGGGTDGSFVVTVAGGIAPYVFDWSGGPPQADGLFTNVSQGLQAVLIEDVNGCDALATVELNELTLVLSPVLTNVVPTSCYNTADGSITAIVSNGLAPFLYDWGNGFQSSNTSQGLAAGNYVLTVTDANLCEGTFQFTVPAPSQVSIIVDTVDILCFGNADGMAIAAGTGGVGNYTYLWDDGQTTATAEGLLFGQINITVTDGNGCTASSGAFVNQPPLLTLDTISLLNVICFGDSTGIVIVKASGGKKPYRFSLTGARFQVDTVFSGVPAGIYDMIVRDGNGCLDTFTVEVTQPEELIVYAGPDVEILLGEDTDLAATMLNPPFEPVSWQWTPIIGLDQPTEPFLTARPFNTILYTLDVTDSTGCTAQDQLLIEVVKYRPIFIPNSFSPDGDGINDFFMAYSNIAADFIIEMQVFDRWGDQIWIGNNLTLGVEEKGWDGTFRGQEQAPGVYSYFLQVLFLDGEVIMYKGDINLLR